jgi:hypothetical protein
MKTCVKPVCLALLIGSLANLGCHRDPGPPQPLAAENIPSEFAKGFSKAKPQVRELSAQIVSALQSKDYAAAYGSVQNLCALPEATQKERALAARALLTITGLLQTAQSQGDEKAAEVLNAYKMLK